MGIVGPKALRSLKKQESPAVVTYIMSIIHNHFNTVDANTSGIFL